MGFPTNEKIVSVPEELMNYVKSILVVERSSNDIIESISCYADGFPGIMFIQAPGVVRIKPGNKVASELFLYGQTIKPVQIEFKTPFKAIVVQIYPFVAKMIFNVDTKELNDECYNILSGESAEHLLLNLREQEDAEQQVQLILGFIAKEILRQEEGPYHKVKLAVDKILDSNGLLSVKELSSQLLVSERTLQRMFIRYVGLSPKQFSKIIQFQNSFGNATKAGKGKLTDVAYENGYADQSHFIRFFKKFTSKRPSELKPVK